MLDRVIPLTILLLALAGLAAARDDSGLAPGMVNPGYHDQPAWFKQSFLDLRDDVREARHARRRVMLYFYQDGCPYCKKLLEDNFGQRRISETAQRHFDTVAVNMWGDREVAGIDGKATTEKAFAADLKVMFTPTLLLLDEQGRVAMRINGYYPPERFLAALEYVGGRHETRIEFREYFARRSPVPASGVLHHDPAYLQPPYRLRGMSARSGRPLLVLFEQKQCVACDELHLDVFKRPATQALLKRFDVALIDMWSAASVVTPAGSALPARQWAQQLKVQYAPTLVFFGANGDEVFRADAYLKSFHIQSVLDYVASGAYISEPSFQRFIEARADDLRKRGVPVDLMD